MGKVMIGFTKSLDGFINDQNGAPRVVFYRKSPAQNPTNSLICLLRLALRLAVLAILSKGVIGRDSDNSNPQSHPQLLLDAPGFESHGVEPLFPSRNHLA
jgi:hypothetical protein